MSDRVIVEAKLAILDPDLDTHQLLELIRDLQARFGVIMRDRQLRPADGHTAQLVLRCTAVPDHGIPPW